MPGLRTPSIRHELLLEELSTRVSDPQVLRLFQLAIETSTVADGSAKPGKAEKGVPQGLAISNLLAEVAMRRVDGEMKADTNAAYFRYVDDILVLSRDEFIFRS